MNGSKPASRIKQSSIIGGALFAAYNILLFVIAGFQGHGASFWTSYVFMNLAFASIVLNVLLLNKREMQPKDFMFGYPILRHCVLLLIIEFVLSTVFMLLDTINLAWAWAFVPQFLVLGFHLVLVVSCYMANDTIQEMDTKIKDATTFTKLLQVDAEMIVDKCLDPALKAAFQKLAEDIRYSDPISNPCLFELEKQITLTVSNADIAVNQKDYANAMLLCNQAKLLLTERNKKCKALK